METPPRPPKLSAPPVSLEPEVQTVKPLIFMDQEDPDPDMLDMSPKYSDPKAQPLPVPQEEDSGEAQREEDSTDPETPAEVEEIEPDIQEMISPERSKKDEILKLVTNN